jgi:hypothetical protein
MRGSSPSTCPRRGTTFARFSAGLLIVDRRYPGERIMTTGACFPRVPRAGESRTAVGVSTWTPDSREQGFYLDFSWDPAGGASARGRGPERRLNRPRPPHSDGIRKHQRSGKKRQHATALPCNTCTSVEGASRLKREDPESACHPRANATESGHVWNRWVRGSSRGDAHSGRRASQARIPRL